ncbi:hypothetical protein [Pusillimonas sp.]|uniref:hypothetical protein n=1 Tax=Pusillimonas sp. TaxID=3040095 RepID=UPI0029A45A11|nr:hypothetical protein [Pusillimonas sp.]MDX3894240.1 hypothetical protein [Pusillimonas sp.]
MNKVITALAILASAVSLPGCSGGGSGDKNNTQDTAEIYRPVRVALYTPSDASETRLHILNRDDTLTTCTAEASGDLSDCSVQDLEDADVVHQMVVNPRTGSIYLLQAHTDSVLICGDSQNALSSCTATTGGDVLKDPSFIALNADGSAAYLTNEDGTLAVCQLAADGTFSSCTATDVNGTLDTPVAVGVVSGDYGTYAYLLNGDSKPIITACTLAPAGMPSACHAQNNELFSVATAMAFSPDGQYLYVGNLDDNLAICRIERDASLSSCHAVDSGDQELFAGIMDIAVDAAGANAYVVNGGNSSITHCKLEAGGAEFADCRPYNIEGFEFTTDLALLEQAGSSSLFIASMSNDSIYGCPLDAKGGFTDSCIATRFSEQ